MNEKQMLGKKFNIPVRFWIGIMVFLTTYINYTTRVNMSISIISMTKGKSKTTPECLLKDMETTNNSSTTQIPKHLPDYGPRYEWDENTQALVLASYFYGYVIGSLPAGFVSETWGPFKVIFWTHVLSAIMNSLSVFGTWIHYSVLVITRIVLGLAAGLVYPALQVLIAKWAPPAEKGKFVAGLMGNTLATCITWPLVGAITSSAGWDWGFHVVSIQIAVFCVIFFFVAADSPDTHSFISEEEKSFIKEAQGASVSSKKAVPPYWSILKSFPFWMLTILHFGNLYGLYLQLTTVPKFMAEVVGFNLKEAGGLSALPHLLRLFLGTAFGSLGDFLKRRKILSNKAIRKSFVLCSHIIPGILLIGISFVGCNWPPIVALLTFSMAINGAAVLTNLQNPQDLAPNFAGSIFGIISFIGGTTGFIVPAITGGLIQHHSGTKEWGYNFIIGGCVYMASGILFMVFGSVEEQSWNRKADTAQSEPEEQAS
ncbi:sialin isoform X2 [Leptinotarsa decemlineata]|uniref:sialin isoform X2 n=1 Tax=Leptinotarsa decemlineata TaxID=7539 RepID=UPI003D306F2E